MNFLNESNPIKRKKSVKKQSSAKNYAVVIVFKDKKASYNFIKIIKEAQLQEDYLSFSKEEKKIFNLIQNSKKWNEEIDRTELFENIKNSSFKIYYKNHSVQEISFLKDDILSANFSLVKTNPIFPEKINDFVLEINNKSYNDFILTRTSIFYIKDGILGEITTNNKFLLNIIKRSFLKKYSNIKTIYSEFSKTSLSTEEILEINYIKKDLKKIFKLETNVKNDFEIKEIKSQKKILEINYNHKENSIEIIPYLDYGIQKIPISSSVYLSNKGGQEKFVRKANDEFGEDYLINIQNDEIIWNKIDSNAEIDFFKHLFALKNDLGINSKLILKKTGIRQMKTFLETNWKFFKTLPFEKIYLNEKVDFEIVKFKADVDLNLKNSNDLLNLKADFYLGENKISISELQRYSQKKDSYITRDDGTLLKIENSEEMERLLSILNKFKEKEQSGEFEGKLYHVTELQNIFTNSEYYKTKMDDGFKNFLNEIKNQEKSNGQTLVKINIPKAISKILRPYQASGIEWMNFLKKYHFGGILADDMGLGKTLQALTLLTINRVSGQPSIVIAPKTLLGNWMDEVKKFAPELKTIIIEGDMKDREKIIKKINSYDLILTSYSLFQRDSEFYKEQKIKFNYAILDEAQYIKNFRTKNATIVKEVDSNYRLALTGTPLENSVAEIWSIFEFLMPGFLGTQGEFTKKYTTPISKGDKKVLKNLQEKISFFMMRRIKSDVLEELPEKTEQKLFVDLSPDQKILYQEILKKIKKDLLDKSSEENYKKSYIHILAALTKLRQVCNHPNLILKEKNYKKYNSEKLNIFNNLIDEIISEDRKVLVFSQFTSMLDILSSELQDKKIKFSRLDGSTKNRKKVVDDFNNKKENKVFLISLKAGGVGLNLTSADSVIIFDPWWNPSTENQAIDRAHRIGQKKSVNVYKLITKDTIEDKILLMQKEKASLFDAIVNKTEKDFKKMDWEDIKNLFEM